MAQHRVRFFFFLMVVLHGPGCGQPVPRDTVPVHATAQQERVRAVPMLPHRLYVYQTDRLPSGDLIKRWHWEAPWEIRTPDGRVVRRMYAPDWSPNTAKNGGPHMTIIQDPQRGTIYEAFFVQQSDRVFTLAVTLSFFADRDSPSPLFSLSFADSAGATCRPAQVSRGGIQAPGIPQAAIESAHWVGVGWEETPTHPC